MQNLLHRWDLSWTWNFSGIYNCCGANFGYLCQEMVTCKLSCDHFLIKWMQLMAHDTAWKQKKHFKGCVGSIVKSINFFLAYQADDNKGTG